MRVWKAVITRVVGYSAVVAIPLAALWVVSIRMPGVSHSGPLPPLTEAMRGSSRELRRHVDMLAGRIGERNFARPAALDSAADYVHATLVGLGYAVAEQTYALRGRSFRNIEATLPGDASAQEIVIVGGHYDSVAGSPGADDNASGTAGLLELARLLRDARPARTIRFVAFTNEEPPFFYGDDMGSRRYARTAVTRGDHIVAMLSLETIGYYRDGPHTQQYPPILGWFYPDRANYVAVVGNIASRGLVHRAIERFRATARFPAVGTASPELFPGISWSDHWAFWREGVDAVMITDTAPFRNASYHQPWDVADSLNYDHMARVIDGVAHVARELAGAS